MIEHDHPPEVHAELARLQAVAEARESAAAAAEPDGRAYLEEVAKRARAAHVAASSLASHPPQGGPPAPLPVPRVHCTELSLARFRREFCSKSEPVVITGLGSHLTEDGARGADLRWLFKHGGSKKVAVSLDNTHVSSTLKCADTDVVDLKDHLERVLKLDRPNLRPGVDEGFGERDGDGTYLYDCAVPLKLPSLTFSLRVPRYFAHDFLQRTRYPHAFTASWPSLFVAAPHTRSSLHVDQWRGNFWMAMIRGTKRWTLFHADDVPFCAPDYSRGTLDPEFPRLHEMEEARTSMADAGDAENTTVADAAEPSRRRASASAKPFSGAFPFLPFARRWDADLGPGEILFVPGGFPHAVHNLDVTVSFAGNYVDESNLDHALRDMQLLGEKYGDALRKTFQAVDEVWFDPEDETWVEERLEPKQLVVRYEDYRGGKAGFWGANDWEGVEHAETGGGRRLLR
jgi:solute carrier family 25 thiamine pyrophosphate transporter 19